MNKKHCWIVLSLFLFTGCGDSSEHLNSEPKKTQSTQTEQRQEDLKGEIKLHLTKDGMPVKDALVWLFGVDDDESKKLFAASKEKNKTTPTVVCTGKEFLPKCTFVKGSEVLFQAVDTEVGIGFTAQTWSMCIPPREEVTQHIEPDMIIGRLFNDLARGDCDYGYLLVTGHDFGCVSNQDGIATLTNVPNGEFLIRVWHPDLESPDVFVINSKEENFAHGRCEITLNQDVVEGQVIWREQPDN